MRRSALLLACWQAMEGARPRLGRVAREGEVKATCEGGCLLPFGQTCARPYLDSDLQIQRRLTRLRRNSCCAFPSRLDPAR
jgi:hypothetical protein